jgi:hypothetical protein
MRNPSHQLLKRWKKDWRGFAEAFSNKYLREHCRRTMAYCNFQSQGGDLKLCQKTGDGG